MPERKAVAANQTSLLEIGLDLRNQVSKLNESAEREATATAALSTRALDQSRLWLILIAAASLVLASVLPPRPDAIRLAGAACYALAIWTTTFAVIGVALHFLSGFSATRRYVADASYWLYLIHLPIVMALQVAVSSLDWPWPAKFMTILLVAVPPMFVSYQLLVRYSIIGAVLNGRRPRKPSQACRDTRTSLQSRRASQRPSMPDRRSAPRARRHAASGRANTSARMFPYRTTAGHSRANAARVPRKPVAD